MQPPQDQFAAPPQQGYAQPQQGYAQPQQGYAQPQQGYAQPQQMVIGQPGATMVAAGGNQPDVLISYILWFFLGGLGIHHLYMGRGVGIWLVALITFQGLFVWWFIDLFLIPGSCAKNRGGSMVIIQ